MIKEEMKNECLEFYVHPVLEKWVDLLHFQVRRHFLLVLA